MEIQKNYYAIIPANVRYDSRLIPSAKLLYGEITALCNEKGYCWASNAYFATLYGVSVASIKKWLKSLEDGGYINREVRYKEGSKEIDTRWITIVTHPRQEKLPTPRVKNEPDNNTSFNTTVNTTKDIKPSEKSDRVNHSENFDKLWSLYPKGKKQGKDKAFTAYKRALKAGTTDNEIVLGIEAYKKQIEIQHTELHFIKQGATWFNQKCWKDEYLTDPTNQPQQKPFYGAKPRIERLPDWAQEGYDSKNEALKRSEIDFGELPEISLDDDLPF